MARRRTDPKVEALRQARTLNPRPESVVDAEFHAAEFFDARDLLQVKYELVRRVHADGLPGLVPAKPGPRRAHKLTDEVLDHAEALRAADPSLRTADLVPAIADRFGVRVHPRSIERALARREANRGPKSA